MNFIQFKESFLRRLKVTQDCWNWSGFISKYGYGQVRTKQGMEAAHRVSYKLFIGKIKAGLCVCHSCDNRKCVRPSHLWLGTRDDNNKDRATKGRNRNQFGERNSRAKLTWGLVRSIREQRIRGSSLSFLAQKYSCGISTISHVVDNRTWVNV